MKNLLLAFVFVSVFISQASFAFDRDYELGVFQLNRGEFKLAIAEFEPLVAENYSPAEYQMGLIYLNGYGVKKDRQKAFELISLSASQNFPDALFSLALMYTEGEIVDKDLKTAFALTERAAQRSHVVAQYNLGVMYYNGEGVTKDYKKAARWYESSAKQNYSLAQFNLALMYFEGQGVNKSQKMSLVWNTLAARSGYADAIKSRDMDEHKLSVREIQEARDQADDIYQQILEKTQREF